MKKTILTIILTIFAVVILVILANFIRNFLLLNKLINKDYKMENYKYTISNIDTTKTEEISYMSYYKKDNMGKTEQVYKGEIILQIISDSNTNKAYIVDANGKATLEEKTRQGVPEEVPSIKYAIENPAFNIFSYSITHILPTIDINGRECIPIKLEDELYYIEKDTGYLVRKQDNFGIYSGASLEEEGYLITDYTPIQQNVVTDEDVVIPETVQ